MTTPSPLTTNLAAAAALLARAESTGLPLPFEVCVTARDLRVGCGALADLTDWALWLEVVIESRPTNDLKRTHYSAEAVVDGVAVTVWHVSVAAGSAA